MTSSFQPSQQTTNEVSLSHAFPEANQVLSDAYDRFVQAAGWKECHQPLFARCHVMSPMPKLSKYDMEPHILYVDLPAAIMYVQHKKWKITIQVDQVTGIIRWYMLGHVDVQHKAWVLDDEELALLDALSDDGGPMHDARRRDDVQMRKWPYMRGIKGVSYKKADANKRQGPKGDIPISTRASSGRSRSRQSHDAGSGGNAGSSPRRQRCPAGSRRIGETCVPKSDLGKLGGISGLRDGDINGVAAARADDV